MKLAITTLLFVVFLLFVGHFQITFKPFSISMPYWYRAVGVLLFSLAMVLYNYGEYYKGYKEGVKDGAEATIQMIKDKMEE